MAAPARLPNDSHRSAMDFEDSGHMARMDRPVEDFERAMYPDDDAGEWAPVTGWDAVRAWLPLVLAIAVCAFGFWRLCGASRCWE